MRRPLIAVNGLYHAEDPMLRLRQRYGDAVREAGGVPVALVPELDESRLEAEIDSVLERVDGLLLTGGDDFHAEPLGLGPTHPAADPTPIEKQRYDLVLTARALERDLPVLGICFGMQCLGLVGGSTLYQDVPSQLPGARVHTGSAIHEVRPHPGTKLAEVTGLAPFPVVSRHHQALRSVPPPWIVSAVDDEGLVEAIEHANRHFAVGVQWHPELSPADSDPSADGPEGDRTRRALFTAFVEACGARRPQTATH